MFSMMILMAIIAGFCQAMSLYLRKDELIGPSAVLGGMAVASALTIPAMMGL